MRIVGQSEMKEIEQHAAAHHQFSESLVVEHVGLLGAQAVEERLALFETEVDIVVLVGKGNNGADGLALTRSLVRPGRSVRAFLLFDAKDLSPEAQSQLKRAKSYGAKVAHLNDMDAFEAHFTQNALPKVVVDAVFGTGVRLPLSNFLHDVIHFVNAHSNYTIAVDIPTGVQGDTGLSQGVAIKADLTLAVGYPKVGHYVADGAKLCGETRVLQVGFPHLQVSQGDKFLLTRDNLPYQTEARSKFADKKIFGHTLVIGGSHGLTGAAIMAARAAAKAGSGLVTVSTWENQYQEMVSRLGPEVMTGFVPNDQAKWGKILQGLDRYDSIVIGPGLGRSARARRLVLEILNNFPGPLVLDADALNALSLKEDGQVFAIRHAPTIMTPHFGEFARFCGLTMEEVQRRPLPLLREAVERINCAVLLKGPCTLLGLANGQTYFNFLPNDGMATAGVGDVLAGIMGGLLAQDTELKRRQQPLLQRYEHAHQASLLAVYLHTLAGQIAAEKFGVRAMSALSLLETMPEAFARLDGTRE
jgi:hydroxyethylthiazole kinase-like uncharacterized protein yjeF